MSVFCLLCIPVVYFLRRPSGEAASLWALPLGGVAVIIQFFLGPIITPDGFGISRWMNGFIDITGLPAIVPIVVCLLLVMVKAFPPDVDYAGFALLGLAPLAAFYAMSGTHLAPIPLVIVPLLWIAQAVGISFFIGCIVSKPRWYVIIPAVVGIAALPLVAATSWWAFFVHRAVMGGALLAASLAPTVVSVIGKEGIR